MEKKKDISGLFFSAFLVIAFVICSYFFLGLIRDMTSLDNTVRQLLTCAVFVVFGLILFYATRIGDGKQVKRFSVATLLLLDLPALYIILASAAPGLPFPLDLSACNEIVLMASAALGYGLPYTFLSGYELDITVEDKSELANKETYEPDELDDPEEETTDTSDESTDENQPE